SREEIQELLRGADLVFIAAGMGGGTGTGAAPIVAEVAKSLNILTIGVVTKPFMFEGKQRMINAERGIADMMDKVDTLVTIPNDRLLQVVGKGTSIMEAFRVADDVLRQGIQGIADLIALPSLINLDFADVKTIMKEQGIAHMGIGHGRGDNRAIDAAKSAVASPLLETTIQGATGLIINVTGGTDLGLLEVNEAAHMIQQEVDPEANIIFGAGIDDKLDDEVRITVIATGFKKGRVYSNKPIQPRKEQPLEEPIKPVQREERERERERERSEDDGSLKITQWAVKDENVVADRYKNLVEEINKSRYEKGIDDMKVVREVKPSPFYRRYDDEDDDDMDTPTIFRRPGKK
ncbi:MAG TPA: cell division protein FtsZ, partial [Clostridia bacterium]|nr:cell division protein FtsZ [Clostridia bacterium]